MLFRSDGDDHEVPVHWVEYIDVQSSTEMIARECAIAPPTNDGTSTDDSWAAAFRLRGVNPENAIVRRSIAAAVIDD